MTQVAPVGPHPGVDTLFVGALLWSTPADAAAVLALVHDDDVESSALAEVLAAVRRLHCARKPHGPQLVLAELQRAGRLRAHNGVAGQLQAATTSGADPHAARQYAGAVVAGSLRRRLESAGVALQAAAREAPENDLRSHTTILARMLSDCDQRLSLLRDGQE
ncbi:hypothetical protein [Mycobacterium sp. NPDC050041]|uniref:hypothetical protein n=1 Tax=Mycobacterium sp. NPDC050041 TaxID=3364293 RepID=UPI003C2FCC0A